MNSSRTPFRSFSSQTPRDLRKHAGFALVATVSMMVILVIVAIALLSLSTITLRSTTIESAEARARANARMALMTAIGELQLQTGHDTRITAPANIKNENYPQVLGVWKSWEGTDHEATGRPIAPLYSAKDVTATPSGTGRFVNWLVSSAAKITAPKIDDAPDLVQTTPSVNTVPLLADGSLRATDTRQVHVVPTKAENGGRFAWWISGENQKAVLAQPYKPRTSAAADVAMMGQSYAITNPEVFGLSTLISNPESYDPSAEPAKPASRAISRQTMALIEENNSAEPQKKFHDLSEYSVGLLTNSATGGWRKDLSLLTEKWTEIYARYPGRNLPLFRYTPTAGTTATSQVPKPISPSSSAVLMTNNAAVNAATPNQSNFYPWSNYADMLNATGVKQPNTYQAASASWQSLMSYATSYKNFSVNSGVVESPFVWDTITGNNSQWGGGNTCSVINLYNYKHVQRLHPQIARFQALLYARAVETVPAQIPPRYDIRLMLVPVITLWNPYNVGLKLPALDASINEELVFGWSRSLPMLLAMEPQVWYPGGANTIPDNRYRFITPGNMQYFDVNMNDWGVGTDLTLGTNTRFGGSYIDIRHFGASFPPGEITFKPGEAKVFSPRLPGHIHWSGSIRLGEGFNQNNILGFEFGGSGNQLASAYWYFAMKNDRVTKPYKALNTGLGFAISFGKSSGPFYMSNPSHCGVSNQYHNLVALAPEDTGNAYWPPTDVDELLYSVGELANGPWVPLFSISMGPRTTMGIGPGTKQSRPTKGVLQSNPLASMSLVDPGPPGGPGDPKAHPANGTFDITYHSMSANSTLTPNLSTSKGFIATGYQSGDALSRLIMCDIPLRPMASLGELQGWNPRGNNPYPPFQHNLIGNSDATPLIPSDQITPPVIDPPTISTNLMHDDAYCANHLLFDDWFLSSIAPEPQAFGQTISKDINTVYREFLKGEKRLVNRAYRPIAADSNVTDAVATQRIAAIIPSNSSNAAGWLKVASRFEVEGMFNVNTTSVEAWKALLGRAKSLDQIAMHGAAGIVAADAPSKHAVTRGSIATDVEAGSGSGEGGAFANASEYAGFRSLSDDQIEDLAKKVVEQIRLRGPFLSLSEFVNRQLSSNKDLALAGAIQCALNALTDDPMAKLRDPDNSLSDNAMLPSDPKLNGVDYKFPEAAAGASAYGVPGWIRQADILRPLAPILSVRDDTFTIRAYGDCLDPSGKVIAKAWCEAVVKRTREFVNTADAADTINPPTNAMNTTFGRRYEMISFRWLNSHEV